MTENCAVLQSALSLGHRKTNYDDFEIQHARSTRLAYLLTRIRLPRRLYSRDWRAEIISSLQRQRAIAGAGAPVVHASFRLMYGRNFRVSGIRIWHVRRAVRFDGRPPLSHARRSRKSFSLGTHAASFRSSSRGKIRSERSKDKFYLYSRTHAKVWMRTIKFQLIIIADLHDTCSWMKYVFHNFQQFLSSEHIFQSYRIFSVTKYQRKNWVFNQFFLFLQNSRQIICNFIDTPTEIAIMIIMAITLCAREYNCAMNVCVKCCVVYSPIVNLKDRQPRVLCQLFFLVFRRVGVLQAEKANPLR